MAPDVTDAGENAAVAPAGNPDAANDTVCGTPDGVVVKMMLVSDDPACTLPDVGDMLIAKSFGAGYRPVSVAPEYDRFPRNMTYHVPAAGATKLQISLLGKAGEVDVA